MKPLDDGEKINLTSVSESKKNVEQCILRLK